MKKWLKGLGWFFIWFIPIFFLIVIPLHVIHDYINPWKEELNDLDIKKPNNVRLLVGFTDYSAKYFNDGGYEIYKSREWVLFPSVFTEPHTYEYHKYEIKKSGKELQFSKSNQINENAAFSYLFFDLAAYLFSWFVSKPKIIRWYKQRGMN